MSFTAPVVDNPFTRRGLLSAVSSIFDPIGFLSPFTVSGRMLLRKACPEGIDWDETSDDIVVIGREFITAETSAMSVDRTS
jgi:hypothetical protein